MTIYQNLITQKSPTMEPNTETTSRSQMFDQNDTKIVLCDLKTMEKAFPNQESKFYLINLLRRRKNVALILYSDLDPRTLNTLCWGYELGILAEQGCSYRAPWSNKWNFYAQMEDFSWHNQAHEVLQLFIGRVPGSVLLMNAVTVQR